MELRHVRYFLAVAEERNFTNAAARLAIAQSPLSQQIRKLEREIGVELFTRTTRSVALTHAGQVFYDRMKSLLSDTEEAIDAARKADQGMLGKLTVGFTGSATYELLPTLVRAYVDRYPEVTLEVRSDLVTPAQVSGLLQGTLAVGILRPPVQASGIAVETIRNEPVVVLLSGRHPAAVQRDIDLRALRDEGFVAYPDNPPSAMHTVMRTACETAGFVPRIRHVAPDSATLVALVAAGLGIALVPASLRHLGIKGATFRPLRSPKLTVPLALAYREPNVDPLVRRFLETARSVVRSRQTAEAVPAEPATDDDRFSLPL